MQRDVLPRKSEVTSEQKLFNAIVRILHVFLKVKYREDHFIVSGIFLIHDPMRAVKNSGSFYIRSAKRNFTLDGSKLHRVGSFVVLRHRTPIPYKTFEDSTIHNRLFFVYRDEVGKGFARPIKYSIFDRSVGDGRNKPLKLLSEKGTTIYLRQSNGNVASITMRRMISSDNPKNQRLITLAWLLAKITPWKKTVLIYEKESERYEEGASILYENLIEKGSGGFYYVIDSKSSQFKLIPSKYQTKVIYKNTFRHYYYFFLMKYCIGTELPSHSIDLRIANRKVIKKLHSNDYGFIFLQHGVSYMVSYGSKVRRAFRREQGILPDNRTRVVVNSQLEASHFTDYAGFRAEDMYLTGFPKFDRAYRYDDASKIVIMPTWRPWEYNAIRHKPEATRYYKMVVDMLESVPSQLRSHVQLLPHPLFIRELRDSPLAKYMAEVVSYDEVLRTADLLITDYSSISYDAFYRGANVIFWWKELDYCMEQYGGHLMLDEKSAFGDIVYGKSELEDSINRWYQKSQPAKYLRRYRKIVNFHDGQNTNRLVKKLVEDGVIHENS